jgi:hexosaminidase
VGRADAWIFRAMIARPRIACARLRAAALTLAALGAACGEGPPRHSVIPQPASVELERADTFHVTPLTWITYEPEAPEVEPIARFLSDLIGNTWQTRPPVVAIAGPDPGPSIHLSLAGSAALGAEGYELLIDTARVELTAAAPAGLFYGVQTIRQLLPPLVEYSAAYRRPLWMPVGRVDDVPRFEWRGAMLDVARHFRPVEDVKRFIDLMAPYKLNRLHLHLSDDQGWRIEIPGWPRLTEIGGSTQLGGGPGGYYTAADYTEIVQHAASRFVVIVPEIDMPGHTNAALASYPALNCEGVAPELFTGTAVGFSSLCTDADVTHDFVEDVVREISALTPGAYFHVGGDEARRTSEEDYNAFIERAQDIVRAHGKRMVGWDEVVHTRLAPESLVQIWRPLWPDPDAPAPSAGLSEAARVVQDGATRAVEAGAKFILSPADRIYLDMKYDRRTVLGLTWAGITDLRRAYDWEPREIFHEIPEASIAGVEATLWSETMGSLADIEYLAFPRLAAVAELGWSPAEARSWAGFRQRLRTHGARWTALGVNFRRVPEIFWITDPG